eukprot:CAMPEP_0113292342 /NCGR_PEP_ID=MMETSP0008_2-20120614/34575_1 /TAXON_ID=97485 /ORGANISM="Prymnesium parvum" /LENGTH=238 /DNA_ID=CAMNT_0000144403 /DNA_START=414 /DNA_END=1127 /DNA_ORIENTATION=+ /assembly_acc=CAM_ASM_000153
MRLVLNVQILEMAPTPRCRGRTGGGPTPGQPQQQLRRVATRRRLPIRRSEPQRRRLLLPPLRAVAGGAQQRVGGVRRLVHLPSALAHHALPHLLARHAAVVEPFAARAHAATGEVEVHATLFEYALPHLLARHAAVVEPFAARAHAAAGEVEVARDLVRVAADARALARLVHVRAVEPEPGAPDARPAVGAGSLRGAAVDTRVEEQQVELEGGGAVRRDGARVGEAALGRRVAPRAGA